MRAVAGLVAVLAFVGCGEDDNTAKCLGCLRIYSKIAKTYSDCYALATSGTRPKEVVEADKATCDANYTAAILKGGPDFDACVVKYCEPPPEEEPTSRR